MSRPSCSNPSYCLHKASGRAYVTLGGKPVYLGNYGSPESREKYDRVIGEWLSNGRRLPSPVPDTTAPTTVSEIVLAFWRHAEEYHRKPDGSPAGELDNYRLALRPLRKLFGAMPVANFTPLAMKEVRNEMIRMRWARTHINRQLGRLRHVFNWAASETLISAAIADAVATVKGLRFGKSAAKESKPVEPVPDEQFRAVLPFLPPVIRAMAELQLVTGARPNEICTMRFRDLDTPAGKMWHYCPEHHKTAHRGHKRSIPLGPRAREILTPFMKLDPDAFVFSPAESEASRHKQQREQRQTPVQPSQLERAKCAKRRRHRRAPRDHYDVAGYRRAIARACITAFPPPGALSQKDGETHRDLMARLTNEQHAQLKQWRKDHTFHPHRLRHSTAALIRERFGLDAAAAVLGHLSIKTTELYAPVKLEKAERVMREVG